MSDGGKQYSQPDHVCGTTQPRNVSGVKSGCRSGGHTEALVTASSGLTSSVLQGAEGDAISARGLRADNRSTSRSSWRNERNQDLRRRGLAVRRLLRPAVVPDLELPRPRRDVHDLGAAGQPRQELSAGVHRAVPVRQADDGGRRPVHPRDPLDRPVHAGVDWRQPRLRLPDRRLLANVPELQPRDGQGQDLTRSKRSRSSAEPFLLIAVIGQGAAHHQQLSPRWCKYRRPAELPDSGTPTRYR